MSKMKTLLTAAAGIAVGVVLTKNEDKVKEFKDKSVDWVKNKYAQCKDTLQKKCAKAEETTTTTPDNKEE